MIDPSEIRQLRSVEHTLKAVARSPMLTLEEADDLKFMIKDLVKLRDGLIEREVKRRVG